MILYWLVIIELKQYVIRELYCTMMVSFSKNACQKTNPCEFISSKCFIIYYLGLKIVSGLYADEPVPDRKVSENINITLILQIDK